jgi:hypothetical protein
MVGEFDSATHLFGSALRQDRPSKNSPRDQRQIFQFLQKVSVKEHGVFRILRS